MKLDDKRYQLGSFVSVKGTKIAKIISLSEESATVKYKDKIEETIPWHDIYPISIDTKTMGLLGFKILRKEDFKYHTEYSMDIKINGKFYNAKGIVLKDRSIWSFNSTTVRNIHQVQSILWILDYSMSFNLED